MREIKPVKRWVVARDETILCWTLAESEEETIEAVFLILHNSKTWDEYQKDGYSCIEVMITPIKQD